MERRIKSLVRWNALAMVVRANKIQEGIGGHISTFASAATLYEVAFNHFLRAQSDAGDRDIVYFQGHAAPGIYARAFLEGRIPVEKLENFRRELKPRRRPFLLPASVAHARLLGISHRLHGARPNSGHLPCALHQVP
jgi:pyruvate dehydrogenase complex dehydrogenase (E1) component